MNISKTNGVNKSIEIENLLLSDTIIWVYKFTANLQRNQVSAAYDDYLIFSNYNKASIITTEQRSFVSKSMEPTVVEIILTRDAKIINKSFRTILSYFQVFVNAWTRSNLK